MGALTSNILAETFIHLEHTVISNILNKNQIINYYRYVNNILITYDAQKMNIQHTLMNLIQCILKLSSLLKTRGKTKLTT
jgi:hypothetical protein